MEYTGRDVKAARKGVLFEADLFLAVDFRPAPGADLDRLGRVLELVHPKDRRHRTDRRQGWPRVYVGESDLLPRVRLESFHCSTGIRA